jgi:hypothetical protein
MFTQLLHIILTTFIPSELNSHTTYSKLETNLSASELIATKEQLTESLIKHHNQTTQALIQEFNYKERGTPLKYLPNIGYNFLTLTPHITYNTNKLATFINKQLARKAKIKSIQQHRNTILQEELNKLNRYYADLEAEINYYNHTTQLYLLQQNLFNIKLEQYNNLELTPTEFIKSQIKLKQEELKLRKKHTHILKLRNYLLQIAKTNTAHENNP